jgi:hypothetical protein
MEHAAREDELERSRALTDVGAALRRAAKPAEAREPLRLAVDLAHRCGASALEDRVLAELRATGARPRRLLITGARALTPSRGGHVHRPPAGRIEVALDAASRVGLPSLGKPLERVNIDVMSARSMM